MQETFFRNLLDSLYEGVYTVNHERVLTYWNKEAERLSGYSAEEVLGRSCSENILRHVDENGVELCVKGCPLEATMKDGLQREAEVFLHHKEGYRVPVRVRSVPLLDESGEIMGAVEIFSNNTTKAQAMEIIEKLRSEALIDPLTGLGNRRFADQNLEKLLQSANDRDAPFGLLFVDIDHFKQVNDTWGHCVGDRVLTMVAKTLAYGVRPLDVACRWGGEEFIVLVPGVDRQGLIAVAERLRILVENSWIEDEGKKIAVTASFGGTISLQGDTNETIVGRADAMMYLSKECGRNCLRIDEEQ
ncbi:MAG: diguanylate cyclase [Desulfovibrio sp.]|nr:MAG: diguanylate cyclase [Desulfovibrio sp.]